MKYVIRILFLLGILFFLILSFPEEQKTFSSIFHKSGYREETYYGILEIPKIQLKQEVYSFDDPRNDVDSHVELLNDTTPDIPFSNLILAAHSGTSSISYFRDLGKLELGDLIFFSYQGIPYQYQVVNIYEMEKGKVAIKRNPDQKVLTLITCKTRTNKNIIVVSELKKS